MARFMTPRYFTQEQNDAVEQSLRQFHVGDDEGVRIFIIALEYELAEYDKYEIGQSPVITETETTDPELGKLSRDITEIILQLGRLPESSRQLLLDHLSSTDPFARRHDQAYLDAVATELTRIAAVCTDARQIQSVSTGLSESEKHFVNVVAEAYFECFEAYPQADDGEPFTSLLQRVIEISGLNISVTKKELEPILSTIG